MQGSSQINQNKPVEGVLEPGASRPNLLLFSSCTLIGLAHRPINVAQETFTHTAKRIWSHVAWSAFEGGLSGHLLMCPQCISGSVAIRSQKMYINARYTERLRQKSEGLMQLVLGCDSYSHIAKVSKLAKSSLGIITIINWLLA